MTTPTHSAHGRYSSTQMIKCMNHGPTEAAIKSSVMLALGSSTPRPTIPTERPHQSDLERPVYDIESNFTNNTTRLCATPMFRCANVNECPATGDAPPPASNSHLHLRTVPPPRHCTTQHTTMTAPGAAESAHSNNHYPPIPKTSIWPNQPAMPSILPNSTHAPTTSTAQRNATV